MTCAQCRELLDAYIDGELPSEDMAAVREHIASCAECANEHASLVATSRRIGETLVKYQAPDVLKARIRVALAQPDPLAPDAPSAKTIPARRLAFGGIGVAIASSILTFALVRGVAPGTFAHRRAGVEPYPRVDARTPHRRRVDEPAQREAVVQRPRRPLAAGAEPRLDRLSADRRTPRLRARARGTGRRLRPSPASDRRLRVAGRARTDGGELSESARNGYNVIGWRANGLSLEAVSDLNRPELEQFVKAFNAAR